MYSVAKWDHTHCHSHKYRSKLDYLQPMPGRIQKIPDGGVPFLSLCHGVQEVESTLPIYSEATSKRNIGGEEYLTNKNLILID